MNSKINDSRGHKVIFVAHCVLNQNAKVRGIANYPGVLKPVAKLLFDSDVGIYQMPCPEMGYLGAQRWGQVKDQYNSPMFRRYCRELSNMVVDQVEEYLRAGYQVVGFLMEDGSPVCGLNKTAQRSVEKPQWGGMVWYVPEQYFADESGVFCEILSAELAERGFGDIPFVGIPEVDEAGPMQEALEKIQSLLS